MDIHIAEFAATTRHRRSPRTGDDVRVNKNRKGSI